MAKYRFSATHGVHLSEDGRDAWAHFERDESLDSPSGEKGYSFETDDPKVAARLRKVDAYGIRQVKGDVDEPEETPLVVGDPPPANASKASWVDYAAAHGMLREDAQKLSKDELREHFNNFRPVEQDSPGQKLVPPSQPRPNAQSDAEYNA